MPKEQYVLVVGNPVDGLCFMGPFNTAEDASQFGENNVDAEEFWVAALCSATTESVN